MVIEHVIIHGAFYFVVTTGYLLVLMMTTSPRIWGYADYPEKIKRKVSPQTRRERQLGTIVGVPWLLFVLGFPVISTYALKSELGGEIAFGVALLNPLVLLLLANLGDLVILDWLVVSKLTPRFVIIPGSVKEDYKDFSHHYKGHAKAAIVQAAICLIVAGVVWRF